MTGVSGVRGGDGERLDGRRMEGRNFLSPSRRGGASVDLMLAVAVDRAAEIRGLGDISGSGSRRSRMWALTPVGDAALRCFRQRNKKSDRLIRASIPKPEHAPIATLAPVERLGAGVVDGTGGVSEERGVASTALEVAACGLVAVVRAKLVGVTEMVLGTSDRTADVAVCASGCHLLCWPDDRSGPATTVGQE